MRCRLARDKLTDIHVDGVTFPCDRRHASKQSSVGPENRVVGPSYPSTIERLGVVVEVGNLPGMESRRIVRVVQDAIPGTCIDAALCCTKLRLAAGRISTWVKDQIAAGRIAKCNVWVIGGISRIRGSAEYLVRGCNCNPDRDDNAQSHSY